MAYLSYLEMCRHVEAVWQLQSPGAGPFRKCSRCVGDVFGTHALLWQQVREDGLMG